MKYFYLFSFLAALVINGSNVSANHCTGGHKQIKDAKETTTEETKETKKE